MVVESQCGIITSFQSVHFFGLYCQPGEPASRGCMTVGDTHFYTNISKIPLEMKLMEFNANFAHFNVSVNPDETRR